MCIFVIVCVYAHTKPHELLGHLCLICVPLKTLFFVLDTRMPTNTCESVRTRTHVYARAFFTSVVCMFSVFWQPFQTSCEFDHLAITKCIFLIELDQGISDPTMASLLGVVFCNLTTIPNLL